MANFDCQDHNPKFNLQSHQYSFPYHYIPNFDKNGSGCRFRGLSWGLEYLCYQEHVKNLVENMHPTSVLEVGCGDGRFIGGLVEIGRRVGVDLEKRAIKFAQAMNEDVEFYCASVDEIKEVFDVCVAIEVLEHIPDEQCSDFIRSLFAKTKPGGYVVISVPSANLPVNKKHYRHYSEDSIQQQLNIAVPNCEIISIEHIYYEPFWVKFYLRATFNNRWIFDSVWLRKIIWKKIWNVYRHANKSNGHHIVLVAKR